MRRLLLLLPLLFVLPFSPSVHCAFQFLDNGARPVAMGGAFCAVADDAHACFYNPAGMGWIHGRKLAVSYCRPFGLADVHIQEVDLLQPAPWGVLGLAARRFGDRIYQETTLGLAYARPLGEKLALGLVLRGLRLAISGHGSDETFSLDMGFLAILTARLRWGISAFNLNNGRLGRSAEGMPQTLLCGFALRPDSRLLVTADLFQDISDCSLDGLTGGYPVQLRLGQESSLWEPLTLRLGVQSGPIRFSAGLAVKAGPFHLDYAYCSHQLLGGSHHVTLVWP